MANITLDYISIGTWTPLGFGIGVNGEDVSFTGFFDGNSKTISNLEIAMGDPVVDERAGQQVYGASRAIHILYL